MQPARLDDLPPTPATHFRLLFHAAVIEAIQEATVRAASLEDVLGRHRFLATYLNELADRGLDGGTLDAAPMWWRAAVEAWEASIPDRLPLRALAAAADLDYESLVLLAGAGLADEDVRFASFLEAGGGTARIGAATVAGWFHHLEAGDVRRRLQRLAEAGLLKLGNADAPFVHWTLEVPTPVWEAMRGDGSPTHAPGLRWQGRDTVAPLSELCLSESVLAEARRIADLLREGSIDGVAVRGPGHNGRRAVLAALAREAGKSILEIGARRTESAADWTLAAPLAVLLDALPVVTLDPAPGEPAQVPVLPIATGPVGVVLGPRAGLAGTHPRQFAMLDLPLPDLPTRGRLWARCLDDATAGALAERFRMTSGNIVATAGLARAHARVRGADQVTPDDVRAASRGLDRSALDALCTRVASDGQWSDLVLDPETRSELWTLEARCRHRERLPHLIGTAAGSHMNAGVRALLRGPSGTGKTLAARVLAAALGKDLYRVDLSAVVDKYIGETEKRLDRALGSAEELDVVLLFDEGDALLAQRTGVSGANDRYANLETNFLLQRIESYEGILLITTNLADQIDTAFQRRIDAVVDFRLPEADERLAIYRLHLATDHCVSDTLLEDAAHRCALSGGQIRNAVIHASLLALHDGRPVDDGSLEAAIHREYRKSGAVCPLRAARRTVVAVR